MQAVHDFFEYVTSNEKKAITELMIAIKWNDAKKIAEIHQKMPTVLDKLLPTKPAISTLEFAVNCKTYAAFEALLMCNPNKAAAIGLLDYVIKSQWYPGIQYLLAQAIARDDDTFIAAIAEKNASWLSSPLKIKHQGKLTPAQLAINKGKKSVLKMLLDKIPDCTKDIDENGYSLAHLAVIHGRFDLLVVLLKHPKSKHLLNKPTRDGYYLLHLATRAVINFQDNQHDQSIALAIWDSVFFAPGFNHLLKSNKEGETPYAWVKKHIKLFEDRKKLIDEKIAEFDKPEQAVAISVPMLDKTAPAPAISETKNKLAAIQPKKPSGINPFIGLGALLGAALGYPWLAAFAIMVVSLTVPSLVTILLLRILLSSLIGCALIGALVWQVTDPNKIQTWMLGTLLGATLYSGLALGLGYFFLPGFFFTLTGVLVLGGVNIFGAILGWGVTRVINVCVNGIGACDQGENVEETLGSKPANKENLLSIGASKSSSFFGSNSAEKPVFEHTNPIVIDSPSRSCSLRI